MGVEKRRPTSSSTFVPTVRTPEEPVFVPEEPSDTFPSLLLLIRDGKLDEAKKYIEQGADVNEADQHGMNGYRYFKSIHRKKLFC